MRLSRRESVCGVFIFLALSSSARAEHLSSGAFQKLREARTEAPARPAPGRYLRACEKYGSGSHKVILDLNAKGEYVHENCVFDGPECNSAKLTSTQVTRGIVLLGVPRGSYTSVAWSPIFRTRTLLDGKGNALGAPQSVDFRKAHELWPAWGEFGSSSEIRFTEAGGAIDPEDPMSSGEYFTYRRQGEAQVPASSNGSTCLQELPAQPAVIAEAKAPPPSPEPRKIESPAPAQPKAESSRPPASSRWVCRYHNPRVAWSSGVAHGPDSATAGNAANRDCLSRRSLYRRVLLNSCVSGGCYDLWDPVQKEAWDQYWRDVAHGIGYL